jgi:hypothetical protein
MPRSIAVRILALALAVGLLAAVTLPGNTNGVNVPLLVAALLAAAVAVGGEAGLRRVDPADAWLGPTGLLLAAMTAIRTDPWLVALDMLAAASLAAAAIATLGGARVTRGPAVQVIGSAVGAILAGMLGVIEVVGAVLRRPAPAPDAPADAAAQAPHRRLAALARFAPVLRGLVIAIPLVFVFVVLFSAADAVFERITATLLDWRLNLDLGGLFDQGLVVLVVGWGVAGLLAMGGAHLPQLAPPGAAGTVTWGGGVELRPVAPAAPPRLGGVEATTVLVVLDVLFVAFVALQVAYLFGGRDTLAASGLTYAEYARRGFFELVLAAAIAGSIALGLDLAVERRSRMQVVAAGTLLALTMVILASALARLRLYQEAYGWTELRFVVLVSIAWLAAAVVGSLVLLARHRARWSLHVLGVLAVVALVVVNLVGPEAYVAERNLERAANPTLVPAGGSTGLDADYMGTLGDEAIPPTVAALPSLNKEDRAAMEALLRDRAATFRADLGSTGWPSWNLGRERARSALATWEAGG